MIRHLTCGPALLLALALFSALSIAPRPALATAEILAVWVQDDGSRFAESFAADHLPPLSALAGELGVEFRVVDVADGAPAEIVSTPLISFVNARGRSIYQGRYTNLDRVRTFVRTMRFVPQGDVPLVREDVLTMAYGRTALVVPLKVTALDGARPDGHDDAAFEREIREGVMRGMRRLSEAGRVEVGRGDRLFYLDIHPWLSETGELFVSAAAFSHFHCKEPVFTTYDEPHHAPWDARATMLLELGGHLEHALEKSFSNVAGGDAFKPVGGKVPVVEWADVGIEVDHPGDEAATRDDRGTGSADAFDFEQVGNWHVIEPGAGSAPSVQFRFPPPLDYWVGEAPRVSGRLKMGAGGRVNGATGWVEVDLTSVTMGESDLDAALQGSTFLHTTEHPLARFQLERLSAPDDPFLAGRQLLGEARGTFSLKGISVPLSLAVHVEPFVDAGEPRLLASGRFQIELEDPFGIERAEGPAPANNTVVFDLSLVLAPSSAISSP